MSLKTWEKEKNENGLKWEEWKYGRKRKNFESWKDKEGEKENECKKNDDYNRFSGYVEM